MKTYEKEFGVVSPGLGVGRIGQLDFGEVDAVVVRTQNVLKLKSQKLELLRFKLHDQSTQLVIRFLSLLKNFRPFILFKTFPSGSKACFFKCVLNHLKQTILFPYFLKRNLSVTSKNTF